MLVFDPSSRGKPNELSQHSYVSIDESSAQNSKSQSSNVPSQDFPVSSSSQEPFEGKLSTNQSEEKPRGASKDVFRGRRAEENVTSKIIR